MKKIVMIVLLILLIIGTSSCKLFTKDIESSYEGAMFPVITENPDDSLISSDNSMITDLLPFVDSNTGLWGYIDQIGEFVIEPEFNIALEFNENGQAGVLMDDEFKYIDMNGNTVEYQEILEFSDIGLALRMDDSGIWGYVNEEGEFAIKPQFQFAGPFSKNGLACVYNGSGYGWIDSNGEYLIEPDYSWGSDFSDNGLAAVKKEGDDLCGYINEKEDYLIEPHFKNANAFGENGLAVVQDVNELWGFIDESGKYIIEPQFKTAWYFFDSGIALVQNQDDLWGYINEEGEYVIGPK